MKKVILIIVSILFVSTGLFGQKMINILESQKIAETVVNNFSDNKIAKQRVDLLLLNTEKGIINNYQSFKSVISNDSVVRYYYIYGIKQTNERNEGYVIVSAYNAAEPVLGYSASGNWEQSNLPFALDSLMADYEDQIKFAIENQLIPDSILQNKWNSYLNGNVPSITTNNTNSTYLIDTQWSQGRPYNNLTPLIDGKHTATGCVATSMAQSLYYWAKTASNNGLTNYEAIVTKPIPNYSGVKMFNWDSMVTNNPNPNDNSIAELMYAVGMAVKMNYGKNGSGANSTNIPPAFKFFGINSVHLKRAGVKNWDDILRREIDEKRPIIYDGFPGEKDNIGHSFICDGYKSDGTFHFNFGWSGYADNWMVTSAINVNGSNYNYKQDIIYKIAPDNTPMNPINPIKPTNELRADEKVVREIGRVAENIGKETEKVIRKIFRRKTKR